MWDLVTAQNLLTISKIFLILFGSSFAMYYPLVLLTKNRKISAALSVPISLSFQIIIGYLFYTFGAVKMFPLFYLSLIIVINLITYLLIRRKKIASREKVVGVNFKNILLALILMLPVLYTRFYDAVKNFAPGGIDTKAHITLLKQLDEIGYLGDTYYAPGFHLIIYPITKIIGYADIYRFTGPVMAVMTVLSFWLVMRLILKSKTSLIIAILLLCLPALNQLTLQMIYFFPSALTFSFLLSSIYLLLSPKELTTKLKLLFYLIISIGIALSVPYFFVQYVVGILALVIVSLFVSFHDPKYRRFIFIVFFVISCFGILLSLGHVYLQTNLHTGGFPEIAIVKNENGKIVNSSNTQTSEVVTEPLDNSKLGSVTISSAGCDTFLDKSFSKKYLFPFCRTGEEILRVKNIREPIGLLSLGAYLWIIISTIVLFCGIKKHDQAKVVFATFSLVYGIATQTGILEMSYYRGRSGWYLLFIALMGTSLIFDGLQLKKARKIVYPFIILLYAMAFISPPTFYRAYFTEPFSVVHSLIESSSSDKMVFITNQKNLSLLSENVSVLPLQKSSLKQISQREKVFIFFDNKFYEKDPALSQQALSIDKGYRQFNALQKIQKEEQERNNLEIQSSTEFKDYEIFWQNSNVSVYKFKYTKP